MGWQPIIISLDIFMSKWVHHGLPTHDYSSNFFNRLASHFLSHIRLLALSPKHLFVSSSFPTLQVHLSPLEYFSYTLTSHSYSYHSPCIFFLQYIVLCLVANVGPHLF